jgi:preprotein translocase subunit SecE
MAVDEGMVKVNPGQFIREVRREVSKVTWPSRKETTVSTAMVFVMVFVAALFFLLIDQVLSNFVKLILAL